VRAAGERAYVIAGEHGYGQQLDGQLRLAGLPRADDPAEAHVVILCGLAGRPEVDRACALAPLPIIAFDGVQGAGLGDRAADVLLALPAAPGDALAVPDLMAGVGGARRAAQLVVAGLRAGAGDRVSLLAVLRALGPFDDHGDPIDPPVWLWRPDAAWALTADRPLAPGSG
jgi:hypothetical protein